jgi:hypothetical protein
MSRTRPATLALAAIVLALAGCGKSADSSKQATSGTVVPQPIQTSSSARTGPLTRSELIARADSVCGRIAKRRNLLKFSGGLQFELILPQLVAYQRALFFELDKLTPPTSMRGDWSRIVSDTRTLAESVGGLNQYARSKRTKASDARAIRALFAKFAQTRLQLQTTAKRAGFKACATY